MRWILLSLMLAAPASADEVPETLTLDEFQAYPPKAKVLLLGTFHFKDAGKDSYKPETDIDIRSEQRQDELREVLDLIVERFGPTKIALEADGAWAERMRSESYPAYLRDETDELGPNEVYQVGFRLGRELGLEELYFIDASGRRYADLPEDTEAYAAEKGQSHLLQNPWDARYFALYRNGDRKKADQTLREIWLDMNRPERLLAGHGHYVLSSIALGDGEEYPGADHVTGWWYNRNLRIFANIHRIAEQDDRILVLIGAGHVPILRHAIQASPEFELVEVSEVLGK